MLPLHFDNHKKKRMSVYKFRLLFDEVEDFVRDYEILSNQTFEDFHNIIVKTINGLNNLELASFYTTDRKWEKTQEITLIDMSDNEAPEENRPLIMSNAILSNFIDDPHQRMIYEYDFLLLKTFYIELLKVTEENPKITYPICTHSVGELPKAITNIQPDTLLEENTEILEENDQDTFFDEGDLEGFSEDFEI